MSDHFGTLCIKGLKKVFTTCCQKTLEFSQWLLLLTIINFIIAQFFAEHRFLKSISARLVLTSKFFFEFDSMFCYHKFRMLQKGFSQLFFAWSVKWWVSLKLWNNHSRDWINNFPFEQVKSCKFAVVVSVGQKAKTKKKQKKDRKQTEKQNFLALGDLVRSSNKVFIENNSLFPAR